MCTASFIVLFLLLLITDAVDRNKFKKCDDVSFCTRHRSITKDTLNYSILPNSLVFDGSTLRAKITEKKTETVYLLELIRYKDNVVRMIIDEEDPIKARYRVKDVILDETKEPFGNFDGKELLLKLDDKRSIKIDAEQLRFDFYVDQQLAISANNRGLFYYEYMREKPAQEENTGASEGGVVEGVVLEDVPAPAVEPQQFVQASTGKKGKKQVDIGINFDKAWEQQFGGSTDSPKFGPQSVGMDISFAAHQIYGLPEHTTQFALKSTKGADGYSDPYRLYNLDVFEYELDTPMALYGGVPFVMAQQPNLTTAVLWLNAAETWVDVEHQESSVSGYLGSLLGYSEQKSHRVDTHWISEAGVIDVFFFLGPTPRDVWRQYGNLVGKQELPPLFAVGYHQCRWNYNDEKDVAEVNAKFEELDIPYDVIWLDIEHTNGKRYFTWDPKHFATPAQMIAGISKYGRKMVTIVDPHIKKDTGYAVHTQAESDNVYIKDGNGRDAYSGFCWPGSSSWIDFLSPDIRNWWAQRFSYSSYEHSSPDLHIWNDMNEPSVFSGPEVTMEKNAIHYDGWEHRDVHNIYGMLMHRATSEGLVMRNPGQNKRSFVLARAFFVGSQRFGAVWTGDNTADWGHLAIVQPMLLSLGIAGITFSGADVGGFFGNPSNELLLRWYQAGAYHPFFRAHAHHDTKRREPWVNGQPWTDRIRDAIITRYSILPYLYTLLYESSQTGVPALRPLWSEFPEDTATYTVQDAFLLGALLVKPVTKEGQVKTEIDLPGGTAQLWYDVDTYDVYSGGQHVNIDTPLERIAVLQRGGSIVARKNRIRRSSAQMVNDPFTLIVALNSDGTAYGELYIDDGDSFDYKSGTYVYRALDFAKTGSTGILKSSVLGDGKMYVRNKIEKIVIAGIDKPTSIISRQKPADPEKSLFYDYDQSKRLLSIKNPDVVVSLNWQVELRF